MTQFLSILVLLAFMAVVIFIYSDLLKTTSAFKEAMNLLKKDKDITNAIGDITGYGFFMLGSAPFSILGEKKRMIRYGNICASFNINLIGTKGNGKVTVALVKKDHKCPWEITKKDLK